MKNRAALFSDYSIAEITEEQFQVVYKKHSRSIFKGGLSFETEDLLSQFKTGPKSAKVDQ